jgi:2-polyprenyl-3-methyl-5-hydroxy-6-metoxy-1,4-benzoquinol methylase
MSQSKFSQRSAGIEIMDDLNCEGEVVHQTLRELEFINRTLGGNAVTVDGVKKLVSESKETSIRVLDLGCGGGDMLKLLRRRIRGKNTYIGIDANPHIVEYARLHNSDPDISFETANIFSDEFKQKTCDVAIATLFFHHFSDEQLVLIFSQLKKQARLGIVINDLHRHPLAYYSIKLLTKLFSNSSMVKFDAPLSVLRGFSRKELQFILLLAGIDNYTLRWKWAFRWQIVIKS